MAAIHVGPCRRRDLLLLSLVAASLFLFFHLTQFGIPDIPSADLSRIHLNNAQLLLGGEHYADNEPPANSTLGVCLNTAENHLSNLSLAVWSNNSSLQKDVTSESLTKLIRKSDWIKAFYTRSASLDR